MESAVPEAQDSLSQARAGDPEAFGEVCRLYAGRLFRQALALTGNASVAEELAEDTLVEAWRCLRRYNGHCQFFTWLCAILLNRYRNTIRARRWLWFHNFADPAHENPTDGKELSIREEAWPDQLVQQREQSILVRKCVQALPQKHQQVIYLRFFVDDSLEGIAAALGCSVGTVKSRLFHALEKLRAMKELRGWSADLSTKM